MQSVWFFTASTLLLHFFTPRGELHAKCSVQLKYQSVCAQLNMGNIGVIFTHFNADIWPLICTYNMEVFVRVKYLK